MRKILAFLALPALLSLQACASSLCDRAEEVGKRLDQKAEPCREDGQGVKSTFTREKCESGTQGCTSEDEAILRTQLDCIDALETCDPEKKSEWNDAFQACTPANAGVTGSCGTGGI